MQNGLSVDVEDWFQVGAFERTIDRADWPTLECWVEANCDAVLHIFADAGATGTFFTLGWVAERYPALIKRIVAAGPALARHGRTEGARVGKEGGRQCRDRGWPL